MAKFVIELDYWEDRIEIDILMSASEYQRQLVEAFETVRQRLSHGDIKDEEIRFLEDLRTILYVE